MEKTKQIKIKNLLIGIILLIGFVAIINFASAATNATVCCEKVNGFYCQDVAPESCPKGVIAVPTSCRATSYCKPGVCYNSREGTCLDNTPQKVCESKGGTWALTPGPQCDLGCCVLGDQASFVTLVRCKNLSASLGLQTNFKKDITNEASCIASVQNKVKGACVYEFEFQKTCKITTKSDCINIAGSGEDKKAGNFYAGKLCTAEELETICGPTPQTTCLPGKEEVYYLDSCGNIANIYDKTRYNDNKYWTDIISKEDSCNPSKSNAGSSSCGNCNYVLGGFCRTDKSGNAECADLNCKAGKNDATKESLGGKTERYHGESWCVYSDLGGKPDNANNAVGSRFYKHICINGEVVVEQCDDFRAHVCIEGGINYTIGGQIKEFSQAICRVNRWQDCINQKEQSSCENIDKRDCKWVGGNGLIQCVPLNSPGLKFWEEGEAGTICAQASTTCVAKAEKGLIINTEFEWKGDCVESGNSFKLKQSWIDSQLAICRSMGDCGNKINWLGKTGDTPKTGNQAGRVGYSVTIS